MRLRFPGPLLALLAAVACTESFSPPSGVLQIVVVTTGIDVDPDGYQIVVNQQLPRAVAVNDSLILERRPGERTVVTLNGLAGNCIVPGSNQLEIRVGEDLSVAAFSVICGGLTGVLHITSFTSGDQSDPDGYTINISGPGPGTPLPLPPRGFAVIPNLPGGAYQITLSGLAPSCVVAGGAARQATIKTGHITRDTTFTAFFITCLGASAEVTAPATGPDQDSRFSLSIDDVVTDSLGPQDILTVPLEPGTHSLQLGDIASNCSVQGPNPVIVTIAQGERVGVTFPVLCLAFATVRVSALSTGPDRDSVFILSVDGVVTDSLGAQDILAVPLNPGSHSLLLGDIAPNCAVQGPNPVSVSVVEGGGASITFSVLCLPNVATARISAPVTGGTIDTSFRVGVDIDCDDWYYTCEFARVDDLPSNGTLLVDLPSGTHDFLLLDLAANCTVPDGTFRSINFAAGDTLDVVFAISCAPAGTVRVTAPTQGSQADLSYGLALDGGGPTVLGANDTIAFDFLPAGPHTFTLSDVSVACRVNAPNPFTVTVAADVTSDVVFPVSCDPDATLVISSPTTGVDLDVSYDVLIDQAAAINLPAHGFITVPVYSGSHAVRLAGLAVNCSVTGPNPVNLTVPASGTANVSFPVTCVRYTGTVRITVTTSGLNAPTSLTLDYNCDFYYGCSRLTVPANGVTAVDLAPGSQWLAFPAIPGNCTVSPANFVQVTVTSGVTVDVAFAFTCQ